MIRAVRDARSIREVIDLDGDGQPEEQRLSTLDGEGRVVQIEKLSPDGATVLSRETRTWDGRRLLRRQTDRLLANGTPGADGTPDEDVSLGWRDGQLQTESVDQLDAEGLLGVDGKPEIVTTWAHENGVRVRGTQVDVRDDAVLRVDQLEWDGERLIRQRIDLGGDGEDDITLVNTWRDGRVVSVHVEGELQTADVTYEYCQ